MTLSKKQEKHFSNITKGFKKKEKKDGRGWVSKILRKKDDTLTSCPHHRLSYKGRDRCVKGGYANNCSGLNTCDYFQDLKER